MTTEDEWVSATSLASKDAGIFIDEVFPNNDVSVGYLSIEIAAIAIMSSFENREDLAPGTPRSPILPFVPLVPLSLDTLNSLGSGQSWKSNLTLNANVSFHAFFSS